MQNSIFTKEMLGWTAVCITMAAPLILLLQSFWKTRTYSGQLPPGPPGWPVVGNLFDLSSSPQQTFVELQQKYGPVFMLRFGAMKTVVIASADAAMELFKNHDHAFSNRHLTAAMNVGDDYATAMTTGPYGPYWRMTRRLCTTKLFSHTAIKGSIGTRRKCVDQMIHWISEEQKGSESIELRHIVFISVFNLMGNLLYSRDLFDLKSATAYEMYELFEELARLTLQPNIADFVPWLQKLDPQNLKKRMMKAMDGTVKIVERFAEERSSKAFVPSKDKDFWDATVEFEGNGRDEPEKLSERQRNLMIVELFFGSSETTTTLLEWAMTELLRNPEVMKKVQAEIGQVVGYHKRIEESDTENLPYLDAVLKETMRLHPVVPFLVPRTAAVDTIFMGHLIPKGTQVLVNVWGIGRDPTTWEDPLSFMPERFLGINVDYHGQHFGFLPFGSGRRICPGLPMSQQLFPLALGSLLQSFDWALESGVTPQTIDMEERFGMTLRKKVPLKVTSRASALAV